MPGDIRIARKDSMSGMEIEIKSKANESALHYIRENMGDPKILRQRDIYYEHPCRNYAKTDESVRIRYQNDECFMTYKGPKIDRDTKTREEIEFPVNCEKAESFLEKAGFLRKIEVVKERRLYHFNGIEVCVDDVEGLGTFIEIEKQGDPDVERPKVLELAKKMGLKDMITLSYMEMLMENSESP